MSLAGARVLITGGAGFVGSHIVDQLVDAGCSDIVVIDNFVRGRRENLTHSGPRSGLTVIEGDIRQYDLMDELVRDSDIVFHQAALRITHCAAEPRQAFEVMVQATFDLIQMCVAHGIRRVVMASSASIYGTAEQFPTSEANHPYANRTLYGAAKLFGEGLLRAFNDMNALEYVALRYFNVYGPRMDIYGRYTEVLIRWIERIEAGKPPIIFGDGSETMDMVHVRDVARANILAATAPVADVALNIASASEVGLHELAIRLAQVMGRDDLLPEFQPRRGVNPVPRRLADTSEARRLLDFCPTINLDEGLRDLVSWWRTEQSRDAALVAAEPAK
jgi:UDP-glucose 4-epimerase